jgi:cell division protein FtsL
MSRHAAATTAGRRTIQRGPSPSVPRRVSGPSAPNRRDDRRAEAPQRAPRARIDATGVAYADAAFAPRVRVRPAPRTFTAPRPQRLAYGGVAIASRMAGVAVDVSASRAMDRLVRSRVWIGIIAFGLIGLVAMQVSLLKLNSGIGRAVQTSSTLERSNATLRAEISTLSAGDRIQKLAEAQNMVMPAPSDITYLRAGSTSADAVRAARQMHAPDPALPAGFAGAATQAIAPAITAAPVTTVPAGTAPAGTAPAGTAPAGTAPAGTAPATPPPGATAAPVTPPSAATAAAAPTGAVSGGASPQQATATTP